MLLMLQRTAPVLLKVVFGSEQVFEPHPMIGSFADDAAGTRRSANRLSTTAFAQWLCGTGGAALSGEDAQRTLRTAITSVRLRAACVWTQHPAT